MSKKKNKSEKSVYSTKDLKIKKFSAMLEAKTRNEDGGLWGQIFSDKGNKRAMDHLAGLTKKYEDKVYTISVDKPFTILVEDYDDFQRFKRMLYRYKIPFTEKEEIKKSEITEN